MRVIILTASSMHKTIDGHEFKGRCITGLDLENNRIIRFVQNEKGAPLEKPLCNKFLPLDTIDISVIQECPLACQTENVIADYDNAKDKGKYKPGIEDLYQRMQATPQEDNSYMRSVSYKLDDISPYIHSLELIKVQNLSVYIETDKTGKAKTKCDFTYDGKSYTLYSVTDPKYFAIKTKTLIGDAILAVSIPTEKYDDGYYKFVAAIYPIS